MDIEKASNDALVVFLTTSHQKREPSPLETCTASIINIDPSLPHRIAMTHKLDRSSREFASQKE
jgi:hypothetical protein